MTPRYEAPSRSTSGTDADLLDQLRYADGRPYGFYKNALGAWDYGDFIKFPAFISFRASLIRKS